MGYVDLIVATLLDQHHNFYAINFSSQKVTVVNKRKVLILDEYVTKYLTKKESNLTALLDVEETDKDADFIVIVHLSIIT